MFDVFERILNEAGAFAAERCHKSDLVVSEKGRLDFVTDADRDTEALIVKRIRTEFPDDAILGEEGGARTGRSGRTWIMDPIDGTHNFVRGSRDWAVTVALVGDGLLYGGIYLPVTGQMLVGGGGEGVRVAGRPFCRPKSGIFSLCHTGVSTWLPFAEDQRVTRFVRGELGLADRRTGSAAVSLAAVVTGEADLYVGLGEHIWDVAGGAILAAEAGLAHTLDWSAPVPMGALGFACGTAPLVAAASSHGIGGLMAEREESEEGDLMERHPAPAIPSFS